VPNEVYPCPNCDKNVAYEARYCLNCGEPLFSVQADASETPQIGYPCPYCDVTVSCTARFCPICGQKLHLPGKNKQQVERRGKDALTVDERSLLDYLQQHDYQIRLSEAAKSLEISARRIRLLLWALQTKGKVRIRRTF
jgi:hypothetical protein